MRGKELPQLPPRILYRITPAYAGKSGRYSTAGSSGRDHPRVCGEKDLELSAETVGLGSPPRMRGKEKAVEVWPDYTGITPAYAGKSPSAIPAHWLRRDHPRVCGEKTLLSLRLEAITGSPPRMRGKALSNEFEFYPRGITPAYAGKRRLPAAPDIASQDHPRVCGEKLRRKSSRQNLRGSPPRMRGKAVSADFLFLQFRITPAYAGKSSPNPACWCCR